MGAVLTAECERARSWVSLGLDGELSQVEQALLRAHVGRCARCAEFALDLGRLTEELRRAPLERPAAERIPLHRPGLARGLTGMRVLRVGAAAAAIVLAAGLGSLAGSLSSHHQVPVARAAQFPLHGFQVASLHPTALPGGRLPKSSPI
jgi:predicted anti-sigma-YlaC factor YlaD